MRQGQRGSAGPIITLSKPMKGNYRRSGEPYDSSPLAVAQVLADLVGSPRPFAAMPMMSSKMQNPKEAASAIW